MQQSDRGISFVYQVERLTYVYQVERRRLTYADSRLKPDQVANSAPDLRCLEYLGKSQAALHVQLDLCEKRTVQSSCLFAYRA